MDRLLTQDEAVAVGFEGTLRDGSPPHRLEEVFALFGFRGEKVAGCPTCDLYEQMKPPHFPSRRCESGWRNHCSCDVCF